MPKKPPQKNQKKNKHDSDTQNITHDYTRYTEDRQLTVFLRYTFKSDNDKNKTQMNDATPFNTKNQCSITSGCPDPVL